jgi:hypothetical protein
MAEVNALNFAPAELVKNQVGAHAWSLETEHHPK